MPRFFLLALSLFNACFAVAQTKIPCDSPLTYIQRIGQADAHDRAYGICPSADGNLYLAGYQRDENFIAKITPIGKCLWLRKFSSTDAFGTGTPVQIMEDSDGNIVLCAAKGDSPTSWLSLVMRYDPKSNTILWAKQYKQNSPTARGILEKGAGGNFILHAHRFDGSGPVGKTRSELYELDRLTGEVLPNKAIEFRGDTHLVLSEMVYRDDALWVVGSTESDDRVQPAMGKISASLDSALWITSEEPDVSFFARNTFTFGSIISDGADFLIAGTGLKLSGGGLGIRLQKSELSGAIIWAKNYEVITENVVGRPYMVTTPNGYTMMLTLRGSRWILVNLDKNGAVLDHRLFTIKDDNAFLGAFSPRHKLLLYHKGYLLALDHTRPFQDEDIVLIRTTLDLEVEGNCVGTKTAQITWSSETPITQPYSPVQVAISAKAEEVNLNFSEEAWEQVRNLCPQQISLGPDQNICQNQTTTLDAGPGFASYKWSTGASTRTLLVKVPGSFSVEVVDSCGQTLRDTVKVSFSPVYNQFRNIPIFPGDTVVIAGVKYGQSATVVQKLKTKAGCDSTVTHNIFLIQSKVDLKCPADLSVTLAAGATTVKVDYDKVTASTDCPNPNLVYTRLQGPPSGGSFPSGTTTVCYRADNLCKVSNSCCFTVTVLNPELPCDAKNSPDCLRFELLETRFDAFGQRRYRFRVVNTCSVAVQYVYVQSPNGVNAVAPTGGSVYITAPAGREYEVRNPNASPFPSIRFKARTSELKGGASDIFEQILPQQSEPAYMLIGVRLENGAYYEAYLNTFNCPAQPYDGNREKDDMPEQLQPSPTLRIFPNPTTGVLYVNFPVEPNTGAIPERNSATNEAIKLLIVNSLGQIIFQQDYAPDNTNDRQIGITLERGLSDGIYLLSVIWPDGKRKSERFVLER